MPDEPQPSTSDRRRVLEALPDIVASAATGVADLAISGTPSVGALAPVLGLVIRSGVEARARRGSRVLETAAEQLGGRDQLATAATSSEARLELTVGVIEAAMRTVHEQKIKALGRVLANGLDGHATVDEARILSAALDAVEAPHTQVLAALRDQADANSDAPVAKRAELLTMTEQQLGERLPGHKAVLRALTQVLEGHHLVVAVSGGLSYESWGGPGCWAITDLGRSLLALVEVA
jgi:hypothetical protein